MYSYITDTAEAIKAIENTTGTVGIDTETRGLDPILDDLLLIQIATLDNCIILDHRFVDTVKALSYFTPELCVFHNAKFDIKFLMRYCNWYPNNLFDTMLAEKILTNGIGDHLSSLKSLVKKYFNFEMDKEVRDTFQDQVSYFSDKQLQYAADDALYTLKLYPILAEQLIPFKRVSDIEFPLVNVLADMELAGTQFSEEVWKGCIKQAEEGKRESEAILRDLLSKIGIIRVTGKEKGQEVIREYEAEKINLNSIPQVKAALIASGIKVKTTGYDDLSMIGEPLTDALIKYRGFEKKLTTYGQGFLDQYNIYPDHRIRTQFNQLGAQSGRLSSENPNMQNIPNPYKNPDETINYRKAFIASC